MKVDFSELWQQVRRITPDRVDWDWSAGAVANPIDIQLAGGIEIDLEQLEVINGLLAIQGRQVLLYIPDQYRRHSFQDIVDDPAKGNRFHVADCKMLEDMRARGRFGRYIATNNLSGMFQISAQNSPSQAEPPTARLLVCRYCLGKLNYQNYTHGGRRTAIWRDFDIGKFFEIYSTNFRYLPTTLPERTIGNDYTEDWSEISRTIRQECGFQCDECRVDLSDHQYRRLLHVHHINGVRTQNQRSNLRPLCADCHRKQPMHEQMFISASDMAILMRLRRQQQVSDSSDWDEALQLADTAAHGALHYARHQNFEVPEIGYEFVDDRGAVTTYVEAAWPGRKIAIFVLESPVISGWTFYSTLEFLEQSW